MTKARGSKTQKKTELHTGIGGIKNRSYADGTVSVIKVLSGKSGLKQETKACGVSGLESRLDRAEEVGFGDKKGLKKKKDILSKRKQTAQQKPKLSKTDVLKMGGDITLAESEIKHEAVTVETSNPPRRKRKSDEVLSGGTSKISRIRQTTADKSDMTDSVQAKDSKIKSRTSQVKKNHRQSKAAVGKTVSHGEDRKQTSKLESVDHKPLKASELNEKKTQPNSPNKVKNQKLKENHPTPRSGSIKTENDDSIMVMTEDSTSSDSEFEEVETRHKTPDQFSLHFDSKGCHKGNEDSSSDFETAQGTSASFTSNGTTGFTYTSANSSSFTSGSTTDFTSSSTLGFMSPSCSTTGTDSGKSGPAASRCKAVITGKKAGKSVPDQKTKKKEKNTSTTKTGSKKPSKSSKKTSDQNKSNVASSPKKQKISEAGEGDIMALLMQMEGQPVQDSQAMKETCVSSSAGQPSSKKKAGKRKNVPVNILSSDSNEESDWEEVEDHKHSPVKSQIPDAPVQVTITDPGIMHKKRKKKEFDWAAYVQRRINRLAKEIQVDMHKVHLLCLLAHSMQQNSVCCDVTLCATALSIIPASQLKKNVVYYNPDSLLLMIKWFKSIFTLTKAPVQESHSLVSASQLLDVVNNGSSDEARHLVMVFVSLLRAIGFNVRLVMSLHPLQLKVSQAATSKSKAHNTKKGGDTMSAQTSSGKKSTQATGRGSTTKNSATKSAKSKSGATEPAGKNRKESKPQPPVQLKPGSKPQWTKKRKSTEELPSSDSGDDDDNSGVGSKRRVSSRSKKDVKFSSTKRRDSDDFELSSATDGSNFSSDEEEVLKKKKRKVKQYSKGKALSERKLSEDDVENKEYNSEDDFDTSMDVESLRVKHNKHRKNRKVLSPESSPETMAENKLKSGRDYWLEVYLPAESKWICVDCIKSVVNKPYTISSAASQPLLYILGFENDGSVKDITARYAPQWLSHTRKQRVDSDWWREALEPYATQNTTLDDRENDIIKNNLIERPLPTNIGDFKNHPLYALRRHLLKYEAIYPESSIPMGYIRGEPIYARECVHTLHSRDNWLRDARLVRIGETAYKMVKSRKQWRRGRDLNSNPDEPDLELFGRWQTEDFIPPPAVNGKVPKNEYGNVELFQPSMLPGGTVHIRVPALNRVAKKLGIDVAAAMTGWDHHCGFSHPVLDGWVVCEEHKDVLMAAWAEDQENQRQREEEKREKRVLGNWTTLVRGLLIKERLKKKFNLEEKAVEQDVKKAKGKAKKEEKATDLQHAWPAKQQHAKKPTKENPPPHTSHFEVETM